MPQSTYDTLRSPNKSWNGTVRVDRLNFLSKMRWTWPLTQQILCVPCGLLHPFSPADLPGRYISSFDRKSDDDLCLDISTNSFAEYCCLKRHHVATRPDTGSAQKAAMKLSITRAAFSGHLSHTFR
jgi:hypothetical protein